jgi:hypothetical protein
MQAPSPPSKFGRDAHAVRIDNIAHTVGRHEVIDLFSNLIGQVRRCEEHINDEDGRYMDMSFFSRDCARKALCMSGYNVGGVPVYDPLHQLPYPPVAHISLPGLSPLSRRPTASVARTASTSLMTAATSTFSASPSTLPSKHRLSSLLIRLLTSSSPQN